MSLNLSRWKTDFENPVAELAAKTGSPVPVKISVGYADGNVSLRPDAFLTQYQRASGAWVKEHFLNQAGG